MLGEGPAEPSGSVGSRSGRLRGHPSSGPCQGPCCRWPTGIIDEEQTGGECSGASGTLADTEPWRGRLTLGQGISLREKLHVAREARLRTGTRRMWPGVGRKTRPLRGHGEVPLTLVQAT
ncbi:hypothetical protein SKAU_G00018160 [Synaphobranchus kaupii]|uniref:Uncharacterized protein n=1 Tax=Synaphobranchus kaupii TaxID=118154 RepID=A0A9Q1GCB7_SYNKA|nr:hypothetical protein SKAU_G00018160 [Synaphobranchus kaupii]